jgi:hypothetical protein
VIVGSVLLVIAAGVLLGLGLVFVQPPLLYSSIGVSALAALALVAGVRRLTAARAGRGVIAVRRAGASVRRDGAAPPRPRPTATGRATLRPIGRAPVTVVPEGAAPADLEALAHSDPTVPADEPAEEAVAAAGAARIGQLDDQVAVIDGRPRYHLSDCVHLLGLDGELLPVAEAVDLGFTPCALCRPAAALLGRATRSPEQFAGSPPSDASSPRPAASE